MSAFPASEHVGVLITHSPCKNTVMEHDVKQDIIRKEPVRLTFLKKYICLQTQKIEGGQDKGCESTNTNTNTSMTESVNGNESPIRVILIVLNIMHMMNHQLHLKDQGGI